MRVSLFSEVENIYKITLIAQVIDSHDHCYYQTLRESIDYVTYLYVLDIVKAHHFHHVVSMHS